MRLIDSHAHVTSDEIYGQAKHVLERAREAGIVAILNICTDAEKLINGLTLSKEYPWVYHAAATHPHDVDTQGELLFDTVANHARSGFLKAIGETGLDYHYEHSYRNTQQKLLKRYLNLALECRLPVVIHCREAFEDFFAIIDEVYRDSPGVLHCFTGTLSEAKQVLDRGWMLSLSGIVTFKKSDPLREVAKYVPLDRLLIETDAPFLAPQSKRGKPNESSFLPEIAQEIARVKGLSPEHVAEATTANACRLFHIELT